MLHALAGFPFNLVLALLILAVYRPYLPWLIWPAMATITLVFGFLLPIEYQIPFWSPGGTANMMLALAAFLYFYSDKKLLSKTTTSFFGDRKAIRDTLSKTASLDERQKVYLNFVGNRQRQLLHNEEKITPLNTRYLTLVIFILFLVSYAVLDLHIINQPEFIRIFDSTFKEAMKNIPQLISDNPEESAKIIEETSAQMKELFHTYFIVGTFSGTLLYTLFLFSVCSTILRLKKLPTTNFGLFSQFKLPEMALWALLGLIGVLIAFNQLLPESPWVYIPANLLGIIALLFALQGMGTVWLFFHIRFMPGGSVIFLIFLIGLIFPSFILMALFAFMMIGLLEFWFDFRKKALHPKMLSDDAP